jgi:hypothetical protein
MGWLLPHSFEGVVRERRIGRCYLIWWDDDQELWAYNDEEGLGLACSLAPDEPFSSGELELDSFLKDWKIIDSGCPLSWPVCAECEEPSFLDYLCKGCRHG